LRPGAAEQRRNRGQQSGGGRSPNAVGTGGAVVRTVWLTSGAHAVLYFPKLSKLAQTWKLKMDTLPCNKNSQFLYVARMGYFEQFSQLCRHPIVNIIRVKNLGTDSTFESLVNFKSNLNLLEKSDKFSKIPS
jgi:hypothetical protein